MKIYITGDGSRYQYLIKLIGTSMAKELLGEEFTVSDKDIHIINSSSVEYSVGKILSKKIPLNTEIVIAGNTQVMENFSIDDIDSYDKVLIFDEFPYRTGMEIERTESIAKNYKVQDYEVFLIKKEDKSLKSDISTANEAMLEAKKSYEKDGHRVSICSIYSNDMILNYPKNYFKTKPNTDFKKRLQIARDNLEYNFDLDFMCDYEIYLKEEISNSKRLDGYISIEKIQNKNVRETFIKEFRMDLFGVNPCSKILKNFIDGIYRKYTKDILVWNINSDVDFLYNEIDEKFLGKISIGWDVNFTGNDIDYIMFKKIYSEDIVELKQCAISFFEVEMPIVIKCRVLNVIKSLEELLYD